ncbi:hypothetical protein ES708_13206 [subsurface metagenome]
MKSPVFQIPNIDISVCVDSQCDRCVELSRLRTLAAPLGDKVPIHVKFLDTVVGRICYVNKPQYIYGNITRLLEPSPAFSRTAPLAYEISVCIKFLYPLVSGICNVYMTAGIYGNTPRAEELALHLIYFFILTGIPVPLPCASPVSEQNTIIAEFLDSIVGTVRDIHTSRCGHCQTEWNGICRLFVPVPKTFDLGMIPPGLHVL